MLCCCLVAVAAAPCILQNSILLLLAAAGCSRIGKRSLIFYESVMSQLWVSRTAAFRNITACRWCLLLLAAAAGCWCCCFCCCCLLLPAAAASAAAAAASAAALPLHGSVSAHLSFMSPLWVSYESAGQPQPALHGFQFVFTATDFIICPLFLPY